MTDERIRRDGVGDDESRKARAGSSRAHTEDRVRQDRERVKAFIQELDAEVLPSLPRIDGFHTVWLSTTHQTDSVHKRARMGYEPIKPEDLPPGYGHLCGPKGSQMEGFITCNEMVGYKIPKTLYDAIMQHFHHDTPLLTEEQIRVALENVVGEHEEAQAELSEGFKMMGRAPEHSPDWEE